MEYLLSLHEPHELLDSLEGSSAEASPSIPLLRMLGVTACASEECGSLLMSSPLLPALLSRLDAWLRVQGAGHAAFMAGIICLDFLKNAAHSQPVQAYLGEQGLSILLAAAISAAPQDGVPLLHSKVIGVFRAAVNLNRRNQETVANMLVGLLEPEENPRLKKVPPSEFAVELVISLLSYTDLLPVSLTPAAGGLITVTSSLHKAKRREGTISTLSSLALGEPMLGEPMMPSMVAPGEDGELLMLTERLSELSDIDLGSIGATLEEEELPLEPGAEFAAPNSPMAVQRAGAVFEAPTHKVAASWAKSLFPSAVSQVRLRRRDGSIVPSDGEGSSIGALYAKDAKGGILDLEYEVQLEDEAMASFASSRPLSLGALPGFSMKRKKDKPGKRWKGIGDFDDNEKLYKAYLKNILQPGMELRCVNGYEVVEAGDTGVFKQWNDGTPPVQVDWRNYGSKYWVYWRDVEIIDKEADVPLDTDATVEPDDEEEEVLIAPPTLDIAAPTAGDLRMSVLSAFSASGGVEALVALAQRISTNPTCRQWLKELEHCLVLPSFRSHFIKAGKNRRLLFDALRAASRLDEGPPHDESEYFGSFSGALTRLFISSNSTVLLQSAISLVESLLVRLSQLTHEAPRLEKSLPKSRGKAASDPIGGWMKDGGDKVGGGVSLQHTDYLKKMSDELVMDELLELEEDEDEEEEEEESLEEKPVSDVDAVVEELLSEAADGLLGEELATSVPSGKSLGSLFPKEASGKFMVKDIGKVKSKAKLKDADKKKGKDKLGFGKKGKGYGYDDAEGGTTWDPESYLKEQESTSSQLKSLFGIFLAMLTPPSAQPGGEVHAKFEYPRELIALLESSAFFPVLESYLRNDSLMDMAKNCPLYFTIIELVSLMATSNELAHFVLDRREGQTQSLAELCGVLSRPAEFFLKRLPGQKLASDKLTSLSQSGQSDDDPKEARLAYEILGMCKVVKKAVDVQKERLEKEAFEAKIESAKEADSEGLPMSEESEVAVEQLRESYLAAMEELRFTEVELGGEDGNYTSHHYASQVRAESAPVDSKIMRLAQEVGALCTALPVNLDCSMFMRCDEERMDVMSAVIMGPTDTPYESGAYEFHIYAPSNYPVGPPKVNLETTGKGAIRFNPNLYNCGKVCLSLLGTWSGSAGENWDAKVSTLLQVMVSIQSLIMVDEPYYNEPGYEREQGTDKGEKKNLAYSNVVRYGNVKYAMLGQLRNPPLGFEAVVKRHFFLKRESIVVCCDKWVVEANDPDGLKADYSGLVMDHNPTIVAKFHRGEYPKLLSAEVAQLKEELEKLDEGVLEEE